MKIVQLNVENFKRIVAVEIHPDGDSVIIKGKNGHGKSSLFEAAFWALAGKEGAKEMPIPVRKGADKTTVRIVFDDGLTVEKTATATGRPALKVSDPTGRTYASPQAVCDAFFGMLAFEPLKLKDLSSREQVAMLLEATGQKEILDEIEAERKDAYEARTEVNREVKRLENVLKSHGEVDVSLEPKDAQNLLARITEAQQIVATRRELAADMERHRSRAKEMVDEAAELRKKAAELDASAVSHRGQAEDIASQLEAGSDPDIEVLQAELADIEEHNAAARRADQVRIDTEALAKAREESEALTAKIQKADDLKVSVIEEAELPIAGLTFDADGVWYNGHPFVQASQAEQVRIGIGLAMALNPKMQDIFIREASRFDEDSMAIVHEMALERGYRVWLERVGTGGEVGIIIEDGRVVEPQVIA